MDYRNLGISGLQVSPICLGTAFRGEPEEDVCLATIDRAIELGINFVDCANVYQNGRCERIVGKALKNRRDELILTSKVCVAVGDGPNDRGLSRHHILREVENSLARLQTDHVDIYIAHTVDHETPIEETLSAFDDLIRQGKVRYIGCSNFEAWRICKALWTSDRYHLAPFICVQDHYNLIDRRIERELVPLCRAEGLGLMTYSGVAVGLLTGQYRHGQPPPPCSLWSSQLERFKTVMTPQADQVVEGLIRIAAECGRTAAQVALTWLLCRPGVSAAMIGPESPEQVEENIKGIGWELLDEQTKKLDEASAWAIDGGQII